MLLGGSALGVWLDLHWCKSCLSNPWLHVISFVIGISLAMIKIVEEPGAIRKFGKAYTTYRNQVPMFSLRWVCLKELFAKNKFNKAINSYLLCDNVSEFNMNKRKDTQKYPQHYRWNFVMGMLHGITFSFGMAFSEPFSVLPLFLRSFTSSKIVIGFLISIIKTGSSMPQLFIAHKLQNLSRGKPILFVAIWVRWLAWGLLAMVTFIWGHKSPYFILAAFVFFLFIFSFAGGVANVPFFNMIAKAIPTERRGRFFGMRQFWGGIAAIGAGLLVRIILSLPTVTFPQNYGYLFLVTFVVLTFGYVALSLFKEPESKLEKTIAKKNAVNLPTITHYLKNFPPLFHLLLILIFSQSLMLALPFFVLNAREMLHFPTAWVGYFVMAQMGGGVISNFLWARLSDQRGNVLVIRLSIISALLAILFALFSKSFILYLFVFIFSGSFLNGAGIGFNNYIMELGTEKLRPLFLSIQGTFMFPVYFFPLFGGLMVDYFSFHILFLCTFFLLLISLWLSTKLCEPRQKEAGCDVTHYMLASIFKKNYFLNIN